MYAPRFDMDLINFLKDLLSVIHDERSLQDKRAEFLTTIEAIEERELLLILYELAYSHYGFRRKDIEGFFNLYEQSFNRSLYKFEGPAKAWHPIRIFKKENTALLEAIDELNPLMASLPLGENDSIDKASLPKIKNKIYKLGEFINHFNRKEKLFFPLLERYGQFSITRLMWAEDDRIRNLYRGMKGMLDRLENLHFIYFKQGFTHFYESIKEMIYQEETFLLPILYSFFTEADWLSIHEESDAYGYTLIDPIEEILNRPKLSRKLEKDLLNKQIPFGKGYLTLKEANAILNNLPVEITFVDKFGGV